MGWVWSRDGILLDTHYRITRRKYVYNSVGTINSITGIHLTLLAGELGIFKGQRNVTQHVLKQPV